MEFFYQMDLVILMPQVKKIINTLKKLIEIEIPIFGICLGHQILSLALGC